MLNAAEMEGLVFWKFCRLSISNSFGSRQSVPGEAPAGVEGRQERREHGPVCECVPEVLHAYVVSLS